MNAVPTFLRPALLAGGLAVAAVATATTWAVAGEAAPHNEQVALVNETGAQLEHKSDLNGSAQVTSRGGRFVVFSTDAALVPWDTNGTDDVYLRDTGDDVTVLVSSRKGDPGNDASFEPTVSATGRYVAFTTWATDLARDANGPTLDVVVKDMQTDRIRTVSVTSTEKQRKRNSFFPVISGSGRFVSFQTFGRLGPKDSDKNEDVYVRDVRKGTTAQVSLLPGGQDVRGPVLNGDISDNGRLVVFGNDNTLWARHVAKGTTVRFWHEPDEPPCQPVPAGSAGRPVISGSGTYVAFSSCATDLPGQDGEFTDVYRMELATGEIEAVTDGAGHSYLPSLSRTGRYVGLGSEADNLVEGDTGNPDAFVADLQSGTITRASQAEEGTGGDSWSATTSAAISGNGHSPAYVSYADNLLPGDAFDLPEVFVWRG